MLQPIIALVTRETRLQGLKARWATAQAAAFRMEQAVAQEKALRRERRAARGDDSDEFTDASVQAFAEADDYTDEDRTFQRMLKELLREIDLGFPIKTVDRTFLPNFDFGRCVAVVVLGPDGLVANTAKYAGKLPIIGINPDPSRNDGVLLPFQIKQARNVVRRTLDRETKIREVTLAEAVLNDGQRLLAFNDLFVGAATHVSARYSLEAAGVMEQQSSSGILISTGAGSTGWMSSMYNMTRGLAALSGLTAPEPLAMRWEDRRLLWIVREPFSSKHSAANLVAGMLREGEELVIGSQMPTGGVIFSDGIESDFLEFTSGSIARVRIAQQRAHLVVG